MVSWYQNYLNWTREEWLRTVWTKESSFSAAGFSHRPSVFNRLDEEYHQDCIDEVWGSGRVSVMVWGTFAENYNHLCM